MNTPPDNEPGGVYSSHLARAAKHFDGAEENPDPAELWGRRIGRALSAVAVIALAWLFGRQTGWW